MKDLTLIAIIVVATLTSLTALGIAGIFKEAKDNSTTVAKTHTERFSNAISATATLCPEEKK